MLAVGGGTAVAAGEDLVAVGQCIKHQVDRLRNGLRQYGSGLDLEFGTFVEVREDALIIHSLPIIVQARGMANKHC